MKRVPEKELDYPGRDARYHHGGGPFTGVAYTLFQTGELESETEYRDGVPWGLQREFRLDGVVQSEGTHAAGYREGYWRTWHPNGQLASEEWCHIGLALTRKQWDPAGNLLEDYLRLESDPYYRNMLENRRIWASATNPSRTRRATARQQSRAGTQDRPNKLLRTLGASRFSRVSGSLASNAAELCRSAAIPSLRSIL